jgi:hypothetical protein
VVIAEHRYDIRIQIDLRESANARLRVGRDIYIEAGPQWAKLVSEMASDGLNNPAAERGGATVS